MNEVDDGVVRQPVYTPWTVVVCSPSAPPSTDIKVQPFDSPVRQKQNNNKQTNDKAEKEKNESPLQERETFASTIDSIPNRNNRLLATLPRRISTSAHSIPPLLRPPAATHTFRPPRSRKEKKKRDARGEKKGKETTAGCRLSPQRSGQQQS
ncbi:hypothetical protein OUZ56_002866 [Daphnia magna]|uniref:Uncharacterized protein n=1 Tax=Daphnia magna TaxID=35525 RepID=A0ABR0A735_9CRUS|nr:hypothetical protein OUZ56_002866 [Daphnia magna]